MKTKSFFDYRLGVKREWHPLTQIVSHGVTYELQADGIRRRVFAFRTIPLTMSGGPLFEYQATSQAGAGKMRGPLEDQWERELLAAKHRTKKQGAETRKSSAPM